MSRIVVVTDSTASLPQKVVAERGIVVIPLQVVIGADVLDEGSEGATPELVADALREFRPVSTSRPSPSVMLEAYEQAAREGATGVVSVHLSGQMSGTFESAQLAAREASIPVTAEPSSESQHGSGFSNGSVSVCQATAPAPSSPPTIPATIAARAVR